MQPSPPYALTVAVPLPEVTEVVPSPRIIQPEVVGLIPSVVTFDAEGEHAVRHVMLSMTVSQVTSAETGRHRGHGLVGKRA